MSRGEAFNITVTQDTGTPRIDDLKTKLIRARIQRAVGTACTILTKNHLSALPANKMGWPSTGFYKKAARGTAWNATAEGVVISIDTPDTPGAMRQRFHGGTINMKDKMLTIPAGPQFYGQRATSFTNLRFALLNGHPALIVGKAGTDRVNFATGKEMRVKGLGPKSAREKLIVAYWLKESVTQTGDPSILPTPQEFLETARETILAMIRGGARQTFGTN